MSHEIVESITDPMAIASTIAYYPNGWIDIDNFTGQLAGFEVADLGQIYQGLLAGPPPAIPLTTGLSTILINEKWYNVAYWWSNSQNTIINSNPNLPTGPRIEGPERVKCGDTVILKTIGDVCKPLQWYHNGRLLKVTDKSNLKLKDIKECNLGEYIVRGYKTHFSEPFKLRF